MTTSRPVFYWHGFCSRVELEAHDKEQLTKLLQGERSNIGFEKLKGANIYSIRSTRARRLLFTPFHHQGQCLALILEILPTHDYQNANCLKPGVIEAFLEKSNDTIAQGITRGDIEVITDNIEDPFSKDQQASITLCELDRYHGQFISLSQEQHAFKSSQSMPLILCGPAGSGKTSTAISLLIDIIEQQNTEGLVPELPIAYLSDKQHLITEVEKAWNSPENPIANTPAGKNIVFLTTNALLNQFSPARDYTPLPNHEIDAVIRSQIIKLSQNEKHPLLMLSDTKLMHEGGIVMLCHTESDYLDLGEWDSNLNLEMAQYRRLFWTVIHQINERLNHHKQYIPAFYRFQPSIVFSTTIFDEGQVGSPLTKLMAMHMTEANRIVICVDALQSSDKERPDVSLLSKKLGSRQKPVNVYRLNKCFRTPEKITRFANDLLNMRRYLTGGVADKTEQTQLECDMHQLGNQGHIQWIKLEQLNAALESGLYPPISTAIVTHPNFMDEASFRFNTGLVFTPNDIGGLEFDNIMIYRFTESKAALFTSKALINYTPENTSSIHLPKRDRGNTTHTLYCSELYTAATRAKKRLALVEASTQSRQRGDHGRRHLLALLKNRVDHLNINEVNTETQQNVASHAVDESHWEKMVTTLIQAGNLEQAKKVWRINLKREEASFPGNQANENYRPTLMTINTGFACKNTAQKIKNLYKSINFIKEWTEIEKSSGMPLFIQILLNGQATTNLTMSITDARKNGRIIEIFKALDLNQDVIYKNITMPLLHFILNQPSACLLLKKVSFHQDEFLFTVLKPTHRTLTVATEFAHGSLPLPILIRLSYTSISLFCHLINSKNSMLHEVLNPWWLSMPDDGKSPYSETVLKRVIHFGSQSYTEKNMLAFLSHTPIALTVNDLFSRVNDNHPDSMTHLDSLITYAEGRKLIARIFNACSQEELLSHFLTEKVLLEQVRVGNHATQSRLYLFLKTVEMYPALKAYFKYHLASINNVATELYRIQSSAYPWSDLASMLETAAGKKLLFSLFKSCPSIIHAIPSDGWGEPGMIHSYAIFENFLGSLNPVEEQFIMQNYPKLYFKNVSSELTDESDETEETDEAIVVDESDELEDDCTDETQESSSYSEESSHDQPIENFSELITSKNLTEFFTKMTPHGITQFESFCFDSSISNKFLNYLESQSNESLIEMLKAIDFNAAIKSSPFPLIYRLQHDNHTIKILNLLLTRIPDAFFTKFNVPLQLSTITNIFKNDSTNVEYPSFLLRLSRINIDVFATLILKNPFIVSKLTPIVWLTRAQNENKKTYSIITNLIEEVSKKDVNFTLLRIINDANYEIFRTTDLSIWLVKQFTYFNKKMSYIDLFDLHQNTRTYITIFLSKSCTAQWRELAESKPEIIQRIRQSQSLLDTTIQQTMDKHLPPVMGAKKPMAKHGSASLFQAAKGRGAPAEVTRLTALVKKTK